MKIKIILALILFFLLIPNNKVDANTPDNIFLPLVVKDDIRVNVHLPEDYHVTTNHYPVLYMHDGEQIHGKFSADFIVVYIDNINMYERWNYLSPWEQHNMPNYWPNTEQVMGGDGDDYLDYIIQTKAWVDNRFRTLPDRANTAIGGFSMGGSFSIYAGLKRPDIFSKVISFSPAVWFGSRNTNNWLDENHLIDFVETNGNPHNVRFWWYVGGNEYHYPGYPLKGENYPTIYREGKFKLYDLLGGKSVYNPTGKHQVSAWLNYFDMAFNWLGW
jgi:predicted alpha/beta superfamily hydrolase